MAGLPGSIPSLMPAGQDEQVRRMRDVERRVDELGPSVARSFKPVIDALQAQVAATAAATAAVAAAQITLTAQQATLTAQQATLTANVADINALIGAQVAGDGQTTDTGSATITIGTTAGGYAPVTFTVPAGFTRAIVSGLSSMYWNSSSAVGVGLCVNINGSIGLEIPSATRASAVSNGNSRTLTGLSGGDTFAVMSWAWAKNATADVYIVTTAWVTYLR